jgi:hypothetical protein
MSKYSFKEVKKLEGQIKREIEQYRKSNIDIPLESTSIPELFNRMYKLDEPTWENLVLTNKDLAQ